MTIHKILSRLEQGISVISLTAAWVLIPIMIGVRTFDIVARQFMLTPNTYFQFVEWRAFLFLVVLGVAHAYLSNAHVRIDVFLNRLSTRGQALVEMAGYLVTILPFCWVLIWYGGEFALQSYGQGEREVVAFGRPLQWLVKGILPVGGLLLLLAGGSVFIRNLMFLLHGADLPGSGDSHPAGDSASATHV